MFRPTRREFHQKAKLGNLIPVYKEILADMETPVSAFRKLGKGEYTFLLESVEGGEQVARYSFIGGEPFLTFKSKGHKVQILEEGKESIIYLDEKTDPLTILKGLLERYTLVPSEGLPRFCGGAVGYIGYDMVRFFEKLPDETQDDLNLPDAWFVFTDTILIFDHVKHKILAISNALIKDDIDGAYKEATEKVDELIRKLKNSVPPSESKPKREHKMQIESNFSQSDFEKAVKTAKEYIKAGDIIQVVLSQRLSTKITGDSFDVYRALRSINPSPYMFFLNYGNLKLIGSSPEILVRQENGLVLTRPIAGTRPRGKNDKEDQQLLQDLLSDEKERAEHIMLVDLGRNDIGRVCEYGSVQVDELMSIEKYSHVMHIVSNVKGLLSRDKDQFDVLRACFPAGTVSGAPKIRAMEIIEELEKVKRGPYAGAVGYFSFSGNMDTCITIRTIVIKDDTAYIQAGAGIVADSVPKREYQETINKAKALCGAIEMAERGLGGGAPRKSKPVLVTNQRFLGNKK